MRLDIYRRAEHGGKFSYLAVPETRSIPSEGTTTDWELKARAVYVEETADHVADFDGANANQQSAEKGCAVTSVSH